jgi:hypothetical protein
MSGLRRGIINPYLKHREAALQFISTISRALPGGKLGLQSAVDFDRENRRSAIRKWLVTFASNSDGIPRGSRVHFLTVSRSTGTSAPTAGDKVGA